MGPGPPSPLPLSVITGKAGGVYLGRGGKKGGRGQLYPISDPGSRDAEPGLKSRQIKKPFSTDKATTTR